MAQWWHHGWRHGWRLSGLSWINNRVLGFLQGRTLQNLDRRKQHSQLKQLIWSKPTEGRRQNKEAESQPGVYLACLRRHQSCASARSRPPPPPAAPACFQPPARFQPPLSSCQLSDQRVLAGLASAPLGLKTGRVRRGFDLKRGAKSESVTYETGFRTERLRVAACAQQDEAEHWCICNYLTQ